MKLECEIFLKEGVLNPESTAICKSLDHLGYKNIKNLVISKKLSFELDCENKEEALKQGEKMCEELLVNKVIEKYELSYENSDN